MATRGLWVPVLFCLCAVRVFAGKSCDSILKGTFDPSRFVKDRKRYTDGRGGLVPPIGSKIFIAWRNRTPPHIPDTAFFNFYLEKADIQKIGTEGALHSSEPLKLGFQASAYILPEAAKTLEQKLQTIFEGTREGTVKVQERSLQFLDANGEPLVVLLNRDLAHALVAKNILEGNPNLRFFSSLDISLELRFAEKQLVELRLLPSEYFSQYMPSTERFSRLSVEERREFSMEVYLENLIRKLLPRNRVSPDFKVVSLERERLDGKIAPSAYERLPHMLK